VTAFLRADEDVTDLDRLVDALFGALEEADRDAIRDLLAAREAVRIRVDVAPRLSLLVSVETDGVEPGHLLVTARTASEP
jgi:hypothetical protein